MIAFSLWGKDPLYSAGLLENLPLAREFYPGWEVWAYHDASVAKETITALVERGCKTILMKSRGPWDGLFWRFNPAGNPNVERMIVRDTDSRLNSREAAAVQQWISSGYGLHVMRDNLAHNVPIMGGMWGALGGVLCDMRRMIDAWGVYGEKGSDQRFLAERVWPRLRRWTLAHDRYHEGVVVTPDGCVNSFAGLAEYNPWDNCGDLRLPNYPKGRIVTRDGQEHQRLACHVYRPQNDFGEHDVRPFPPHAPMRHGTYVGQDIKVKA